MIEIIYRLCVCGQGRWISPDYELPDSQSRLHYSRVSCSITFDAEESLTFACHCRQNQTTWFAYIRCHKILDKLYVASIATFAYAGNKPGEIYKTHAVSDIPQGW